MKIAICLYGQPRDYKQGHKCISNLIKVNNENTYDIFFHCWIDDNIKYECFFVSEFTNYWFTYRILFQTLKILQPLHCRKFYL